MLDTPLDEPTRRRSEFIGGTPIELPGGQSWHACVPLAEVREATGPDGVSVRGVAWTFGANIPAEVNDVLDSTLERIVRKYARAVTPEQKASVTLEAAWLMLARNYDLDPDEFESILIRAKGWTPEEQEELGEALAAPFRQALRRKNQAAFAADLLVV